MRKAHTYTERERHRETDKQTDRNGKCGMIESHKQKRDRKVKKMIDRGKEKGGQKRESEGECQRDKVGDRKKKRKTEKCQ